MTHFFEKKKTIIRLGGEINEGGSMYREGGSTFEGGWLNVWEGKSTFEEGKATEEPNTNIVVAKDVSTMFAICGYKNLYHLKDKIKKASEFLSNGVRLFFYLYIQWLYFHLPLVDTHSDRLHIVSIAYVLCSA